MSQQYHSFQPHLPRSVQSEPQHPSLASNPMNFSREDLDELQNQLCKTGQRILQLTDNQVTEVQAGRLDNADKLSSRCEQEIVGYRRTSESLVSALEARRDAAKAFLLQWSSQTTSNLNSRPMRQPPATSRPNRQATGADESVGGTNVAADTAPPVRGSAETNVGRPSVTRTFWWKYMGQPYTMQVKSIEIIGNP